MFVCSSVTQRKEIARIQAKANPHSLLVLRFAVALGYRASQDHTKTSDSGNTGVPSYWAGILLLGSPPDINLGSLGMR